MKTKVDKHLASKDELRKFQVCNLHTNYTFLDIPDIYDSGTELYYNLGIWIYPTQTEGIYTVQGRVEVYSVDAYDDAYEEGYDDYYAYDEVINEVETRHTDIIEVEESVIEDLDSILCICNDFLYNHYGIDVASLIYNGKSNFLNPFHSKASFSVLYEFNNLDPNIALCYGIGELLGQFETYSKPLHSGVSFSIQDISGKCCHRGHLVIPNLDSALLDRKYLLSVCEKIMDDYVNDQKWARLLEL